MQTKPSWTATNDDGDKLFYYDSIGWIDSVTGCVQPFDMTLVAQSPVRAPEDATHIVIDKWDGYRATFLKHDFVKDLYAHWNGTSWIDAPPNQKPRGNLTLLNNGAPETPCDAEDWHVYGTCSPRPMHMDRVVEVELRNGSRAKGMAYNCMWDISGCSGDIVRWRYAA